MLKQALALWKSERRHKGTTLQRRLILFFASVTVCLVLSFALLLLLFGINGRGEKAARDYLTNELSHVYEAVSDDFGRISLLGLDMAERISASCDGFFAKQGIPPSDIAAHPELLEPLISDQMPRLLSAMDSNACSGAFLLLDATIRQGAPEAAFSRAGFYVRATLPLSVQAVGAKYYCLRGPADIARKNGIELLGQWKMEYDTTGEEFFQAVMDAARENAGLPLSRLYYWTGRTTLHGNSEACFLLCVPLRMEGGAVIGVCGIEVSDRMFKRLYSPKESDYADVFAMAAPSGESVLRAPSGMIAGNSYLTGHRMTAELPYELQKDGFYRFEGEIGYGGLTAPLKLYPSGSPYAGEEWSVAVLMPEERLEAAIKGNSAYLFAIIIALLALSLAASVLISRRYLTPVERALSSIQNKTYDDALDTPYLEINDLFAFLAEKDCEHERSMRRLDEELRGAVSEAERVRRQAELLADKRRTEIDPEGYALFLANIKTLTPKEREVFELYLSGRDAREIVRLMGFTENALKYHNKNIYAKLGVASRKELLLYAALMKREMET